MRGFEQHQPRGVETEEHQDGQQRGFGAGHREPADQRQHRDGEVQRDPRDVRGQRELIFGGQIPHPGMVRIGRDEIAPGGRRDNGAAQRDDHERDPPVGGILGVNQREHAHHAGQHEMQRHTIGTPALHPAPLPFPHVHLHYDKPQAQQREARGRESTIERIQHEKTLPPHPLAAVCRPSGP